MSRFFKSAIVVFVIAALLAACAPAPAATTAPAPATAASAATPAPATAKPATAATPAPAAVTPAPAAKPKMLARMFYHGEIDASMAKGGIDYNNNKIANFHREHSGVDITFDIPLADGTQESQKKAMILASNDTPDMMDMSRADYFKYAAQGVFAETRPLLDKMPDYTALVSKFGGEDIYKAASYKGKLFCFPTILEESDLQRTDSGGLMIRKDVREKLGIAVPKTLEETYAMLQKVKSDTQLIPVISVGNNFSYFKAAYRVPIDYTQEGDKLTYLYGTQQFKDYVTFMNKLYTEKLLDVEYITTKTADLTEKFLGDKAFGSSQGWSYPVVNLRDLKTKVAGSDLEFLPHVGVNGGKALLHNNSPVQRYWVVPAAAKNKDAAVKFMNYMATAESKKVQDYGIENDDYKMEGGKVAQTTEQQMAVTWKICYEMMTTPDSFKVRLVAKGYDWAYNQALEGQKGADIVTNLLQLLPPDADFQKTQTELALSTVIDEGVNAFIMGNRKMDEWDKFVAELDQKGLPKLTDALNKWYQSSK